VGIESVRGRPLPDRRGRLAVQPTGLGDRTDKEMIARLADSKGFCEYEPRFNGSGDAQALKVAVEHRAGGSCCWCPIL